MIPAEQADTCQPEQLATDLNTTLAAGREIRSADLTNGIIDYSIRCLTGSHKNRFVYVNLTDDGEIVGGLPGDRVTLAVENADIDDEHVQIVYRSGIYYLRDLSSTTGTWLKYGNPMLVAIEDKTEIYLEGDIFVFEYGEKIADPFYEYVKLFGLAKYYQELVAIGFDSIEKFRGISYDEVYKMREIVGPSNTEMFNEMCMSHKKILGENFVDHKLIVHGKTRKLYSERDWMMFTIGNSSESTINVSNYEDIDNVRGNAHFNYIYEVQVLFQNGSYWLYSNKMYTEPDLFIRIKPDSPDTELRADDIVKIGKLDMKVCRFNIGKLELL